MDIESCCKDDTRRGAKTFIRFSHRLKILTTSHNELQTKVIMLTQTSSDFLWNSALLTS